MKVNPFSLTRPKARFVEKEFTDSSQPEHIIKIKLKTLDSAELIQVMEIAEAFVTKYLGSSEAPAQMIFPTVGGEPVALSRMLIQNAVVIFQMQATENSEDRYTVEDLIALSVTMPEAWMSLVIALNELQKGEPKNDSKELTPHS